MSQIIEEEQIFSDEDGRKYKLVSKTKEIPRKTYLLGRLHGKYWGEIDPSKEEVYRHSKYYDFNIYEAEIKTYSSNPNCSCVSEKKHFCDGLHTEKEGKFYFQPDAEFQRDRLPKTIPCIISIKGKTIEYSVLLHDPQVSNIKFNRKLHQNEGREVFGTIEADITGFIIDSVFQEYKEREYLIDPDESFQFNNTKELKNNLETQSLTGNVEYRRGYMRKEYYTDDLKGTHWGKWKYTNQAGSNFTESTITTGLRILGSVIYIAFFLLILPSFLFILPFFIIPLLFRLFSLAGWHWILRIIGVLILVAFIVSLLATINDSSNTYFPQIIDKENLEEASPQLRPIVDSTKSIMTDTVITHYRKWVDYAGNPYEGNYGVNQSDFYHARVFKNGIPIIQSNEQNYDRIIYLLKTNDINNLGGILHLFDSLKLNRKLSSMEFAEMVVSFVQDIPYAVVLPAACDPNLYSDIFIRNYLSSQEASCDEFQKFGINSPVEFMATLKGDCDTRTLFLYTILSHYKYDLVLLSSEQYSHSLIGINLPYEGASFRTSMQRYILWETTAKNVKPGVLPKEISNMNYWRISLKSNDYVQQ